MTTGMAMLLNLLSDNQVALIGEALAEIRSDARAEAEYQIEKMQRELAELRAEFAVMREAFNDWKRAVGN